MQQNRELLRAMRTELTIQQRAVARVLGVSPERLNRYERGKDPDFPRAIEEDFELYIRRVYEAHRAAREEIAERAGRRSSG